MLEEQVIPRLLARSGSPTTIHLKRFHSYGIGESHVDALLTGIEELVPDGSVKLGFRAHYPQLETKLTVRGADMDDVQRKLAPVQTEVRKRLGNFIMAEDDQTLEGVVLAELTRTSRRRWRWSRPSPAARSQRASAICRAPSMCSAVASSCAIAPCCSGCSTSMASALANELTQETTETVAHAARAHTGATHALVVLIDLDDGADRIDLGGTIWIAIATEDDIAFRRSRILGGREWVRLGAVELGLDCLRRYLQGLPVVERIDFEKT